ncbi:sensor histidine kinase [Aestuariivita sp.]|uniref:sensor histidine kinase n=1 Tax=Aestuariivita sp. TaxID=1872407 RepID=UPI00216DCECD|nr:sensor histidine kinase [Aestuariivita sp.]MCE8006762.1 histidine kinase [Aestuariivita sp.]
MRDTGPPRMDRHGDVVLGDDWVAPDSTVEREMQDSRAQRGYLSLKSSPLTRRIITFNLIALNILAAGILYLSAARDTFIDQRAAVLASDAALISDMFEIGLTSGAPVNLASGDGIDVQGTLQSLTMQRGVQAFVFDPTGALVGGVIGAGLGGPVDSLFRTEPGPTFITDGLTALWNGVASFLIVEAPPPPALVDQLSVLVAPTLSDGLQLRTGLQTADGAVFAATSPILLGSAAVGVVAIVSAAGEVEAMVKAERERMLQMFIIATLVSIGLSLVLASTIANPLSDLAEAAELGRDRDARKMRHNRIRIPDLTARPDEIGRLSGALRGMVSALYNRIESNEQFAADVAHEIKNPLASLRSAVGTLRMIKRDDQREKLMDVIEHDVRRLDRLVSDISNASRLDSELVKEEEEEFNLLQMLDNLNQYLGEDARAKGIDYITDMPSEPIQINGLEARLAQVFVNLITNAVSFCEDGDAIRVWARKRENRVLVVVEDTGPGIPDQALTKIFKRFYSQRPEEHFGNNSGLGLAISKQIVEAHGGVIWAENIRPTEADITSEPLGARFVVGLPV